MLNVTINWEVVSVDYAYGYSPGGAPTGGLSKTPVDLAIALPILGLKGRY